RSLDGETKSQKSPPHAVFGQPKTILRRREKNEIPKNRQFQSVTAEVGLITVIEGRFKVQNITKKGII
ncbi:MAG: hypothetical protein ABIG11_06680, partial [bacterium]